MNENRTAKLAFFAALLAFIVILLGAYTRLTNAGLSCPDWPNCYGYLTAPTTATQISSANLRYPATPVNVKAAWTEMAHRYVAGCEGILILILVYSLWRLPKKQRPSFTPAILLSLLSIQIMLGMLTVTEKLKPVIVLSHLLTGLSLLSVLWWTYLRLQKKFITTKHTQKLLWLGLIIVALQITLGGWVSTHYAGLACIDFPYCNGELMPNMQWQLINSDLITIHMLHRIGALITALYLMFMAITFFRHKQLRKTMLFILMLVGVQISLGILTIVWLRPVHLALTHHAVGILLLLTLITALAKTTPAKERK